MQHDKSNLMAYQPTPSWVESTRPRWAILADVPSVLLIKAPDEQCWVVASRLAADVIANPQSALGGFMRSHCALLALRHLSNN